MNEADNVQCGHTSWLTGFHLGVSHWTQPDAMPNQSMRFLTLNKVGEVGPASASVSWNLELGLSEAFHEAHVRLFCNGYEVNSTEGGILRAYVPAPGILVVHGPDDMAASLFCAEEEVENDEDQLNQWIALDNRRIQLTRSTDHQGSGALYCLQITDQDEVAASHRAAGYLDIDLKAELEREFQQRLPFFQAHDGTANNPSMIVAVETLVAHLNPAGEEFSGRWLGDQLSENPLLATQHLLSAIATWNLIDVTISKELLRSVLETQLNNGSIHGQYEPGTEVDSFTGTWPTFAQCCRAIWECEQKTSDGMVDTAYYAEILPRIDEHVQFSLEYYSIEASGYHGWQHADEALVPEMFDNNMVSVPLTSLLLCEIEELLFFSTTLSDFRADTEILNEERQRLARNLGEAWNEKAHAYTNYYLNGEPVTRLSLGSYLPMRWTGVDPSLTSEVEKQLKSNQSLLTPDGMALWQTWESDDIDSPIEALHQSFIQPILNRSGLIDQQGAFMQGIQNAQTIWFDAGGGLPSNLSLERDEFNDLIPPKPDGFQQDLGAACLLITSQVSSHSMDVNISDYPWVIRWLERHRQTVTFVASLLLFISIIGITMYFAHGKNLDLHGEYAKQGIARNSYKIGRYDDAIARYHNLLEISRKPSAKGDYQFMLGNAYFKVQNFDQAEHFYRESMKNSGADVPQPQWNLIQVLYRLGRYEEAKEQLESWREKYAEQLPDMQDRAQAVSGIIQQQISRLPVNRVDTTN